MITIALTLFKSFFSKLITFVAEHWRIILIVLICAYAYWNKMRYEDTLFEYKAYKAEIAQQAKIQERENALLSKQAEDRISDAQIEYNKTVEAIKNDYLKKQKLDSITIGSLRNRLRDRIAADSFTLPKTPSDTNGTAAEWKNSYAAIAGQYETLKSGCALTTGDYNLLRDWADAACKQVGCE